MEDKDLKPNRMSCTLKVRGEGRRWRGRGEKEKREKRVEG